MPNFKRDQVVWIGKFTRGSAANQYISGGCFNDILRGLGGNDALEGRGGADLLPAELIMILLPTSMQPASPAAAGATSVQLVSDGECLQDQVRDRIGM